MTDDTLKWRKYEDIVKMKRQCLSQGWFSSIRSVFRVLVKKPFPCFYITAEYTAKMIRWKESGSGKIDAMKPSMRRKFDHLYKRYLELREENPGAPKIEICYVIVNEPAPELFMSRDSAYNFYLDMKKRKRLLNELKNTHKDT